MAVVDARVKAGVLKLTATDPGTAEDFSCQVTSIAITPTVNEADAVEVLCGDTVGGNATVSDTLDFTVISDHTSAAGVIAFSWEHRGETVDFEFQTTSDVAGKWTGKCIVQALAVGGAVNEQLNIDASWSITEVTPPTGFGTGGITP